jgi:hypothetical protein
MIDTQQQLHERLVLAFLLCLHIVICCVSLAYVAGYRYPYAFFPRAFHIFYDPDRLYLAALVIAAFALVALLFTLARFSFGYLVGFNFYTMVVGYLWLNCFTDLNYDHRMAGLSAAASAAAFLLPALFISSPVGQAYVLSARAFDRLLTFILLLAAATIAIGAIYNFRLVALDDIYYFREAIKSPTIVNYLVPIVSNALLPFAFAGFIARKAPKRATLVLFLLLLFYPITLSKLAFFTPFWLVVMLLLSKIFEARLTVILSLLGPILVGLVALILFRTKAAPLFSTVNFRLLAIPSVAMDVYNDFFSRHDLTHFCQISILRKFIPCPYEDPLSIVMLKAYHLGNFNASLFATEGIASVGTLFAPIAAFACGLVIGFGNRLSAGLPIRFVLISGAILPQALLNVPLSTALLTHGAAILFVLWYITPRTIFEQDDGADAPVTARRLGGDFRRNIDRDIKRSIISVFELFELFRSNIIALLVAPMVAGLVAAAVVNILPASYTSVAYLRLTAPEATAADTMMRSAPVLDQVLAKMAIAGETIEERRRALDAQRRLFTIPKSVPEVRLVFRLEVTARDADTARLINTWFIDAWIDDTKRFPPEMHKADVLFGEPTLPEEPSYPNKGVIVALAAVGGGLVIVMLLLLQVVWPVRRRDEGAPTA